MHRNTPKKMHEKAKENQQGFTGIEGVLILIIVGLVGFVGWYVLHRQAAHRQQVVMSASTLLEVQDSGSTNFSGWDLHINIDGSGAIMYAKKELANNRFVDKTFPPKTFEVTQLKQSLATTNFDKSEYTCLKSASFGSYEDLIFNNKTIKGIDCYMSANAQTLLAKQLQTAVERALTAKDAITNTTFTGKVRADDCVNRKLAAGGPNISAPPIGDAGCTIKVNEVTVGIVHGNIQTDTWGDLIGFTYTTDITGKRVEVHAVQTDPTHYTLSSADSYVKLLN